MNACYKPLLICNYSGENIVENCIEELHPRHASNAASVNNANRKRLSAYLKHCEM